MIKSQLCLALARLSERGSSGATRAHGRARQDKIARLFWAFRVCGAWYRLQGVALSVPTLI